MRRGVRFIAGVEYLLAGRSDDLEGAVREAESMKLYWHKVKILKGRGDYRIWVHGHKETTGGSA